MQIACYYFPIIALILIGSTVLQHKTYRDILQYRTTQNQKLNEDESESVEPDKKIKDGNLGNALFIFLWIYSIFWCTLFALKLMDYLEHQALLLSVIDWTGCVFKNFLKADQPDAWKDVCGEHSQFRLPHSFLRWGVLWTSCHSLLVVAIYLPEIWLCGVCYVTSHRVGFENSPNGMKYDSSNNLISEDIHMDTTVHVNMHVHDVEGGIEKIFYPNPDNDEMSGRRTSWPQLCNVPTSSNEHKL